MNRRHIQLILRQAAAVGRPAETDAELLRRFAVERDESAFAELVRRHGRLVWALCRNLLPSEADADDAFQATFLALARSAGSVRDGGRVGPWLHGVAYRVCLKAKRAAARRKRRERATASAEADRPVADSAWDAALAAVHEEVCRLPESQRVPFVLCCLEGTSATEAANQLGWKLGTLSSRLTRAKQTLIDRLTGRGLPAAVTAAVAVTGGVSTADVPASLVARTAELAFSAAPVSPTILSLAHGVTDMALYRTKLFAAAVLLVGGLTAGVGSGWLATATAQQGANPAAVPLKPNTPKGSGKEPGPVLADQPSPYLLFSDGSVRIGIEAASKWEYDFVLASEMGTTKFVEFLRDREARGWEFIGQATLQHEGKDAPHWVFRRPAGQGVQSVPQVNDVLTPQHVQNLLPFVADVLRNQPVQPNAEANRAKLLEAQIQSLQAELAKIRAQSRKQVTLTPAEVGIDPQEMMTFLGKLAAKRFGPGYRERLELSSTSKGLDIRGDAEAVEWAVGVVRKLNEK